MNLKPIIIIISCAIVVVASLYLVGAAIYFGGRYYFEHSGADETPTTSTESPTTLAVKQNHPPTAEGRWPGDVSHDETNSTPTANRPHPPTVPILDEAGQPRTFDMLTDEEQNIVITELRAIRDELIPIGDMYIKTFRDWEAGKITLEENGKILEELNRKQDVILARANLYRPFFPNMKEGARTERASESNRSGRERPAQRSDQDKNPPSEDER